MAYDGTLNGLEFLLAKMDEGSPYRKRSQRSAVPFQESQETRGQFNTRTDLRSVFQTDWSDGSFWYKPLISAQSLKSYFTAYGMDANSEPGNLIPSPDIASQSSGGTVHQTFPQPTMVSFDEIYYIENTATSIGLVKWDGSAISTLTNDFGVSDEQVKGVAYDAVNATIFAVFGNGQVAYVTPDSAGGTVINCGEVVDNGGNIFMQFGRLMVWSGQKLIEIEDPLGTPVATVIVDDGMGWDVLSNISGLAADPWIPRESTKNAIASSEGVYIVKNVNNEGQPQGNISRVDRNQEGLDINVPLASLPIGTLCLDVTYHLGSLLMACATDVTRVFGNDISLYGFAPIVIYQYNPDSGLSTVGMVDGSVNPTEAPYKFIGANKGNVYLGSHARVWVYDTINGGLHPLVDSSTFPTDRAITSMVFTTDSGGDQVMQFTAYANHILYQRPTDDEAVSGAYIESNYVDFNIPGEQKTLTHITLMTDGLDSGDEFVVTVEVDDAASFSTGVTFTSASSKTQRIALTTPLTGHRFRYKITFTTSATPRLTPARIKGIVMYAQQGELVKQWTLNISGSEVMNVNNMRQDPDVVIAALETLQALETPVTYVDKFRSTATTHTVRVDGVDIIKSSKAEADVIQVVLTEVEG